MFISIEEESIKGAKHSRRDRCRLATASSRPDPPASVKLSWSWHHYPSKPSKTHSSCRSHVMHALTQENLTKPVLARGTRNALPTGHQNNIMRFSTQPIGY